MGPGGESHRWLGGVTVRVRWSRGARVRVTGVGPGGASQVGGVRVNHSESHWVGGVRVKQVGGVGVRWDPVVRASLGGRGEDPVVRVTGWEGDPFPFTTAEVSRHTPSTAGLVPLWQELTSPPCQEERTGLQVGTSPIVPELPAPADLAIKDNRYIHVMASQDLHPRHTSWARERLKPLSCITRWYPGFGPFRT
eukprot:750385-Hanusia_phi.AAC.1